MDEVKCGSHTEMYNEQGYDITTTSSALIHSVCTEVLRETNIEGDWEDIIDDR